MPVPAFVEGLVEAFVLPLDGGFVGFAGDWLHALGLEKFDQRTGLASRVGFTAAPLSERNFCGTPWRSMARATTVIAAALVSPLATSEASARGKR